MKYYKLKEQVIKQEVPESKGIYFLGNLNNGRFEIGYVGRSDSSLKKRLLSHNHKDKFTFFAFKTVKTKREAFLLETEYWYLSKNSMLNKIHPDVPKYLIIEHPCDTLGKFFKKTIRRYKK